MIQRIQTLWLLLSGLMLFLLFVLPYAQFSDAQGMGYILKVTGVYQVISGENLKVNTFVLQAISQLIVALFPLFILFDYKNRKRQKGLILLSLLVTLMMGVWFYFSAKNAVEALTQHLRIGNIGIGTLLIPLALLFLFLAHKGVVNDEKLIRSADRLR